jgi:cysteine desulfurase
MRFFKPFFRHRRIYLDYASSTPTDIGMLDSFPVIPLNALSANPSALHREGVQAKQCLEEARALAAKTLFAHADEIIFTSGATESDNLAILGLVHACMQKGCKANEIAVFASDIEHAAVKETIAALAKEGVQDGYIPSVEGVIDPKSIIVPEGVKVLIVSVMYVNNEIGTVQPISAIAKRLRYIRKHNPELEVYFHVDATQAPLYYSLNVTKLGVDLMTLGATKLYCAKGAGLLYKKRAVSLAPLMHGGGQEYGLRPGTEAIELVHNFAHALSYAQQEMDTEHMLIRSMQQYFEERVMQSIPNIAVTARHTERSPHITHLAIPRFDSELLVLELDARGIAVSAKSACKNEEGNESEIVEHLYGKHVGAVRFSFGRHTNKRQLKWAVRMLKEVLEKYKI